MGFELSAAAQAKLAARKERYIESLRAKRIELEQLAGPVLEGEHGGRTLDALRESVHKIAGSAGLYGFADLQQSSAALDQALLESGRLEIAAELPELIQNVLSAFDTAEPNTAESGAAQSDISQSDSARPVQRS